MKGINKINKIIIRCLSMLELSLQLWGVSLRTVFMVFGIMLAVWVGFGSGTALCGDPDPNNVAGGAAAAGEAVGQAVLQAGAQAGGPAGGWSWEEMQAQLDVIALRPENYKPQWMIDKNIGHVEGVEAIDALSRHERIVDLKLKIQVLEGDYSTMKTELEVEGELPVESTDLLKLRCDNLQLSHTVITYGNDPIIQGLLRRFDAIYEFFGW